MKMKHTKRRMLAAIFALGCMCSVPGLSAAAVTVDDIANKARELGFPESAVQQGYNEWSTGEYTQEDLNLAWSALLDFEAGSTDMFESILGSDVESQLPTKAPTNPTEGTTGATNATDAPTEGTQAPEATEAPTQAPTKEFAKMTLEEKKAYVSGMTDAERKQFLENLSPEERKSLIKQMSIGDKAEMVEGYLDVAEQMGMHMTVDKITDDNISLTIRDEQGVIIDKSEMGITIDETGIAHTGLLVSAAASAVLALSGLVVLGRKLGKDESEK